MMNCPFCIKGKSKKQLSLNDIRIELAVRKYSIATMEKNLLPESE
jgi:hypothetical protein